MDAPVLVQVKYLSVDPQSCMVGQIATHWVSRDMGSVPCVKVLCAAIRFRHSL